MHRRSLILAALAAAALPAAAFAAGPVPFSSKEFAAAQAADKPILVHIQASWCTTCAAQRPILSRLEKTPEFADLVVFNVDFDSQKTLVRKFRAQMQSTLIVYRGKTERGRSTGETDPARIKALLAKAES